MTDHEKAEHCHRRVEEIREIAKGIYDPEEQRAVLQMAEEFRELYLGAIEHRRTCCAAAAR
jgi:hypothetical protein